MRTGSEPDARFAGRSLSAKFGARGCRLCRRAHRPRARESTVRRRRQQRGSQPGEFFLPLRP